MFPSWGRLEPSRGLTRGCERKEGVQARGGRICTRHVVCDGWKREERHEDVRADDPGAGLAGHGHLRPIRRDPSHTKHAGRNPAAVRKWTRRIAQQNVRVEVGSMAASHLLMWIRKQHQTRSRVHRRNPSSQVFRLLSQTMPKLRLRKQQSCRVLSHGNQVQREVVRSRRSTLLEQTCLPEDKIVAWRGDGRVREPVG